MRQTVAKKLNKTVNKSALNLKESVKKEFLRTVMTAPLKYRIIYAFQIIKGWKKPTVGKISHQTSENRA